jgi:hypothetical protein
MSEPAIHTVISNHVEQHLRAVVHEIFRHKVDMWQAASNVYSVPLEQGEPTDEECVANALGNGEIPDPATRAFMVISKTKVADNSDGETAHWFAQFTLYNLADPSERDVEMLIPLTDLPTPYAPADIIAWGKANGHLNS